MKSHFKILALAVVLSGCSALQEADLLIPPDVIGDDRLICESETVTACDGFLTDKPIDLD